MLKIVQKFLGDHEQLMRRTATSFLYILDTKYSGFQESESLANIGEQIIFEEGDDVARYAFFQQRD